MCGIQNRYLGSDKDVETFLIATRREVEVLLPVYGAMECARRSQEAIKRTFSAAQLAFQRRVNPYRAYDFTELHCVFCCREASPPPQWET